MKALFSTCLLICLAVVSCNMHITSGERVSPSGPVTKESREVSSFNKVEVSGGIQMVLTQSDVEKLDIETNENLFQYIETSVNGSTLVVKPRNGINFKGDPKIIAYLSVNTINALSASGGSRIEATNTIKSDHLSFNGSGGCSLNGAIDCTDDLSIKLSGGGKIEITGTSNKIDIHMSGGGRATMDINCQTLKTSTSGGGRLDLSGSADSYTMSASGGGQVRGFDFTAKHFTADMSGGGSADVTVTETISVKASGGGKVSYKGNAVTQNVSLSGGGSLNKVD